jgi:ferredoxin
MISEDELPRETLDAEIQQILRLGIDLETHTAIQSRDAFEALMETYDAVLLACGPTEPEQAKAWGLKASRRGLEYDRQNFRTNRPEVFAAGCAVRGKAMVVRSTADGKEAAQCIDQYLSGKPVRVTGRPFSSRLGRLAAEELDEFLAGAGTCASACPSEGEEYSADDASDQSNRCLECGCRAHGNCRLERYADMYGADPSRFGPVRSSHEVVGRNGDVMFEPGKCIKCELCIQIAGKSQEPLGLTFVGRGFDVRLSVPFQGSMDDALQKVADECISACPTGALFFSKPRQACVSGGDSDDEQSR